MKKAVLLVTFNRKQYLEKVFAAVAVAKPPRLYLSSDGPRMGKLGEAEVVREIREWMLANVTWPCEVKTRFLEENSGGCGPGVSGAITWFFQHEKDGIILEDDCIPSQTFFRLCEECLDRYADDKRVWQICGDSKFHAKCKSSYFFAYPALVWGWATWADRWAHFDLSKWVYDDHVFSGVTRHRYVVDRLRQIMGQGSAGNIETWDYQWAFNIYAHRGLCVIPKELLVTNCGLEGVHYNIEEANAHANGINIPFVEFPTIVHPCKVCLDRRNNERIFTEGFFPRQPWSSRMKCAIRSHAARVLRRLLPSPLLQLLRRIRDVMFQ